jgi:hypothetical protein
MRPTTTTPHTHTHAHTQEGMQWVASYKGMSLSAVVDQVLSVRGPT